MQAAITYEFRRSADFVAEQRIYCTIQGQGWLFGYLSVVSIAKMPTALFLGMIIRHLGAKLLARFQRKPVARPTTRPTFPKYITWNVAPDFPAVLINLNDKNDKNVFVVQKTEEELWSIINTLKCSYFANLMIRSKRSP